MKPGDLIWVRLFKSDGSAYRWFRTRVESVSDECLITYTPAGQEVLHNPEWYANPVYHTKHDMRTFYWPGRRHDMLEFYSPDGSLVELYANITSPVEIINEEVRFIDHELDVQMYAGQAPRIVDQDEFAEAAKKYDYTAEFMAACYAQAEELLPLMANWRPVGVQRRTNATAGSDSQ